MKKGNVHDSQYHYRYSKNVYNFRLVTNLKHPEFKENVVVLNKRRNKTKSNFMELILNQLNQLQLSMCKNKNRKTVDVVFYIHGGGFLASTSESFVGLLSE
jgi:acetyl esterase/lipase